jgi:parallel beta-helix repeat protein
MGRGGNGEDSRVVVRSFPGEHATIAGRLTVTQDADYVTFEQLELDGEDAPACDPGATCTKLPSPTVNGDHVIFQDNEVTNHHASICFNLGHPGYGRPQGVVIQRNRIHDCGRMNPVSNHDHGIYVAYADNTKILSNVIYDNADRGIQLYPDAQHTLVRNNVIARNGEGVIFSGDKTHASSDNLVMNNVIIDSRTRYNVEYWWSGPIGSGNVVTANCVYGGQEGNVLEPLVGYTASQNLTVAPRFVGGSWPARIAPRSACAAFARRSTRQR